MVVVAMSSAERKTRNDAKNSVDREPVENVFFEGFMIAWSRPFPSGLRERDPAAFQQRIFELSVAAYFHDPGRARDLTPFRVTGRTQQEVWTSLGDYDLRPALPRLRGTPAIVLHGEDDPIPIETARVTADLIGAPLHPLPACGHVPYVEAFEPFVHLLDGLLPASRVDAAPLRP